MSSKLQTFPPEYLSLTFLDSNPTEEKHSKIHTYQNLPFQQSDVFYAKLKSAEQLTRGEDVKTVYDICLDLTGSGFEYQPGDTFGILPRNNEAEVAGILARLNLEIEADKLYKLTILDGKFKIPGHVPDSGTIREALLYYLDLRSAPKKVFLRALIKYTTAEEDLRILNELSAVRSTTYTNFITDEFTTLLDFLNSLPSCFPPFCLLVQHLPRLLPRPYSAASSPLTTAPPSSNVHFVFSVMKWRNKYDGVCTGYLHTEINRMEIGSKLAVYMRKPTNFRLPPDPETTIIMVASGTGLAPFYSFLQHRARTKCGMTILFYGCRYANRDFLYKEQINTFLETGVLNKLFTCASREKTDTKYVQHLIQQNCTDFVELLDQKAVVYVCGGAKMVKDVFETTLHCIQVKKDCSEDKARNFLTEMKKSNCYIEDVWT